MDKNQIDIKENYLYRLDHELLAILLKDRSSGKNIIWATDNYAHKGSGYQRHDCIEVPAIIGYNGNVVRPRVEKSKKEQLDPPALRAAPRHNPTNPEPPGVRIAAKRPGDPYAVRPGAALFLFCQKREIPLCLLPENRQIFFLRKTNIVTVPFLFALYGPLVDLPDKFFHAKRKGLAEIA